MALLARVALLCLFSFVIQAQTWKQLTTTNGLSDNQIRCISGDSTGIIWIGTKTKGIQGYNGNNFITFPKNSSFPTSGGLIYEVTGIGVIDNKMYIGIKSSAVTGYGLWVYNFSDNTIVNVGPLTVIGSQDIRVFHKAKNGQIYAGASDGFYKRVADNNWQKIGSGYVQSITERNDGLIYYTTYDSLFTYNGTQKRGIVKGFFYSVAIDGGNNVYVSSSTDVYKLADTSLVPMQLNGYAKSMSTDKNGKVWIAGTGNTFGLVSVKNGTVVTYTTANSPLLSNDMTYVYTGPDNTKYIGHYSLGLNSLIDAPFVLPVAISPTSATVLVGATKLFTASNGITPYKWWVAPSNLGSLDTAGASCTFKGLTPGNGFLYVTGSNGADTARAALTVVDTGNYPKLPVRSFVVTKGKFPDKVQLNWVPPAEINEGFEDGFPSDWRRVYSADTTVWVASNFQPHGGTACVKFDAYSPGAPETAWLITHKMRITPEKPKLNLYFKTAYAAANSYTSYIRLSTTDSNVTSFTTVLKDLTPTFLADSSLQWRRLMLDLTPYINQNVYIGFNFKAEDIIIYLDDIELQGQAGLNGIAQKVKSYKLYRSETPNNIGSSSNIISNALVTSYTDASIVPLKNYYYAVSAVYDSNFTTALSPINFGIAYQQTDSIVLGPVSATAPVVDGVINTNEYTGATKIILTRNGYHGDAYVKTSGNKLFIGYDMFADSVFSENDFALFAFDKDRNYTYTDSVEGLYRIRKTATGIEAAYFPFYALAGFSVGVPNPPGFTAAAGTTSGHVQYEMSLDLSTSFLNVPVTQKIGAYIGTYDVNKDLLPGWLERLLSREYSVVGFGSLTLSSTSTNCANINLAQGWNMVSVPYAASNMGASVLFPAANSPAYSYNSGYVTAATLTNGAGYWIRYPQAATVPVCGSVVSANTIPVQAGWNLIGGYQTNIATANISSVPANIINSPFFAYNNGYTQAVTIESGRGYWVRTSQQGVLQLAAAQKDAPVAVSTLPEGLGKLMIRDAAGNSSAVYFAKNTSGMFTDLPPVPPAGIFDVRFEGDKYIANAATAEILNISGAALPYVLESVNSTLTVQDAASSGKLINSVLKPGEKIQVNQEGIQKLIITASLQPVSYALEQNYPNPFNPSTTIRFSIAEKSTVHLVVYNLLGEKVADLLHKDLEAGSHQVVWNAGNNPTGMYVYELRAGNYTAVKKLVLIK